MSIGKANRITNPRLLAALRDEGVETILSSARRMDACGNRRANLIAGRNPWPIQFLAQIDEAALSGVPREDVLRFIDDVRDAARMRVLAGNAAPKESVGEVLALEAIAEGEANRDAAKLIDAPHDPMRKRSLFRSLAHHANLIDLAKRVLAREIAHS
jgi:hypothetical protein